MIRMLLAAPRSGSGKTTLTCALLRALQRRGLAPCAFKCGPDYIDPMFHRAVLGVESHNLDLFLSDEAHVRGIFARACAGHGAAVCEGVMGFYDGLGGTSDRASAWHVADTLDLPVILVLDAHGASLTLAAEIRGLCAFRKPSHIAGVILNACPKRLFDVLAPTLERESGVPVLGCLPRMEEARIESRHLGLKTAGEIEDLSERLDTLARALEETVDLPRLLRLCKGDDTFVSEEERLERNEPVRLAVASDKALSFTYEETLETLARCGAAIVRFSLLEEEALPENCAALYLPGGYPELCARELSANKKMLESIKTAVENGLPTVAECGGFLYLLSRIRDAEGTEYELAGVLPGDSENAGRAVRFGYETLCAETDSLLFRAGERIPAHEFHHWEASDCGDGLRVEKGERTWRCGFVSPTLYAGFPHLYFAGRPELAERLVAAARAYGREHGAV